MAVTQISDVIVPDVFNPYVIERTAELSALWFGGIISTSPELDRLAAQGGNTINMPFWSDLTGADEVLSDSSALTPGKITASQDIARLHLRGRAWQANDLAKALSGSDPMGAIADLVAAYWARRMQAVLISSLKGVFADNVANDSNDMVSDVALEAGNSATSANLINATTFIDALGTMGDAWNGITGIAMHSVPFQALQKAEVIVYEKPAGTDITIPTYLGRRVIVDDGCPVVAGATNGNKYTSYLFGDGAVGFANAAAPISTEIDRDSLAGNDILINRQHFVMHPRGVKFTSSSVAGAAPTNTECENAANWDRVYERKNVRLAQLVTNG